jgi:hypothetical protein
VEAEAEEEEEDMLGCMCRVKENWVGKKRCVYILQPNIGNK